MRPEVPELLDVLFNSGASAQWLGLREQGV